MLSNYGKIWALGSAGATGLLDGDVIVQEKIDGSQFSFGKHEGQLFCRSKGANIEIEAPEKMFVKAVEMVKRFKPALIPNATYRGEYLQKPKHNVLAYDRVPESNIILFDVQLFDGTFLNEDQVAFEAHKLGLEKVPTYFDGPGNALTPERLTEMLQRTSVLGGQKIEGVVIKNRLKFSSLDGTLLKGKVVSEDFKEIHKTDWKISNPGEKDILAVLGDSLRTPARWNKAIQHLRERGALTHSVKDIGPLMKELETDLDEECKADIIDQLYKWAFPKIKRKATFGFPEYYKQLLAESAFKKEEIT